MRVGAVDLGTNSTRLLVADVDDGRIADLERDTRVTRLGEGVDERRRLLPAPSARRQRSQLRRSGRDRWPLEADCHAPAAGPGAAGDRRARRRGPRRRRPGRDPARRPARDEGERPARLAHPPLRGAGGRGATAGGGRARDGAGDDTVDRRLRPAAGHLPGRAPCRQWRLCTCERRRHAAGQTDSGIG
jgi:hypothetical protein